MNLRVASGSSSTLWEHCLLDRCHPSGKIPNRTLDLVELGNEGVVVGLRALAGWADENALALLSND